MKIDFQDQGQLTVMALRGELAAEVSDNFRKKTLEKMDQHVRDFVLDVSGLEYVDSAGLESLLWLQDQCAERLGQVCLASCSEQVDAILEMTRLAGRFDRHGNVDDAVQSLR